MSESEQLLARIVSGCFGCAVQSNGITSYQVPVPLLKEAQEYLRLEVDEPNERCKMAVRRDLKE